MQKLGPATSPKEQPDGSRDTRAARRSLRGSHRRPSHHPTEAIPLPRARPHDLRPTHPSRRRERRLIPGRTVRLTPFIPRQRTTLPPIATARRLAFKPERGENHPDSSRIKGANRTERPDELQLLLFLQGAYFFATGVWSLV